MRLIRLLASLLLVVILAPAAFAEVRVEAVEYSLSGSDHVFRGYLAFDDAARGKRPGVLVCHEWWGCNDYAIDRARQLAALGYVAFALDMYGKDNVTSDPKQASAWAGALYADTGVLRARAAAGLGVLAKDARVDAGKLAAIGYCMGGTIALELARSGADLRAVVAFHASTITARDPADNKRIKAKVLICHGAEDTFVKPGEIDSFHAQMREADIDFVFISYAGAVHSFTSPGADKAGIPGVKYHPPADRRSWRHMRDLFDEAFKSE